MGKNSHMNGLIGIFGKHKLLVLIIVLGVLLRFYSLSTIPISLNQDETALGYNAYSLLRTGADEYGKVLPLSLKSFGDWKLPVYPVLDILPIAVFGLTEFAVRFPSAVAGVFLIPLIYILANQIFQNRKISLFAAFFMSVSPWGVFFSRIAYEANIATAMFVGGLIFFLMYFIRKKSPYWLIFTSILWGLTLFTYHAFVVFTPLFFIGSIYLLFIRKKLNRLLLLPLAVFLFFVILSAYSTLSSGSIGKLSSTSLFDDKYMLDQRVNVIRGDKAPEPLLIKKVLHNNFSAVLYQIGQNYISTYSPNFLFDKGGEKLLHNIGKFGNFYLFDALLMILGIIGIFYAREKRLEILILWFLVGPIPSAITTDAPSSTRLFLMLPAFILVMSYGAYLIVRYLSGKNYIYKTALVFLVLAFMVNFIYFIDAYFVHMNYHKARDFHYGYKQVVELADKYPNYKVVMYDPTNFPYISFLFYNKYDPLKFRHEVSYYPANFGPFYYVKSFGRFNFVDNIDYEHLESNTLYIDYRGIRTEDYKILDPEGDPIFKYFFKQ